MSDLFQSSYRGINRAQEHINDLDARIKTFFDAKPYARVVETHTDGVSQAHKIKLTRQIPDSFADITADAVYNLRAALDQAGYAIASESTGKTDPRSAYFPFAIDAANLEHVINRRCKDIPDEILAVFRNLKPYKGGNDILWAINRTCNANKHRMLVAVGLTTDGMHIKTMTFSGGGGGAIPMPSWDSEKNEITFAIVGPSGKAEYDIDLTFTVSFGQIEPINNSPTVPTLNAMTQAARDAIAEMQSGCSKLGIG